MLRRSHYRLFEQLAVANFHPVHGLTYKIFGSSAEVRSPQALNNQAIDDDTDPQPFGFLVVAL